MNLPGYDWHPLKGARKGTFAVSVSGNWRLKFKFDGEDAVDIDLEDYH
jgi:toxin HigB-1